MVPLAGSWKASERGPQSPYKQEEEAACRGAIQVGDAVPLRLSSKARSPAGESAGREGGWARPRPSASSSHKVPE